MWKCLKLTKKHQSDVNDIFIAFSSISTVEQVNVTWDYFWETLHWICLYFLSNLNQKTFFTVKNSIQWRKRLIGNLRISSSMLQKVYSVTLAKKCCCLWGKVWIQIKSWWKTVLTLHSVLPLIIQSTCLEWKFQLCRGFAEWNWWIAITCVIQ